MKLDTKALRYLSTEDWRVLTAVEMGSKNHEVVPTPLITKIASLRSGSGAHKSISVLAKSGLIAKVKNAKYDGYRLTYGGLDYLALHTHLRRNDVYSVGNQIGVGKESDIYVVAGPSGVQHVLKIHRLGRISFRTVKTNRDYLRNRTSGSWMYMSRLAAMKEYAFMQALHESGFPVPKPVAQSRHTLVMELIDAFPLRQITKVPDPAGLYAELMALILQLAEVGLIHGDFNEFNILIKEEPIPQTSQTFHHPTSDKSSNPPQASSVPTFTPEALNTSASDTIPLKLTPILIDFPQMVSTSHRDAATYFDRDVRCIKRFFERRFGFVSAEPGPFFSDAPTATQDAMAIAAASRAKKSKSKERQDEHAPSEVTTVAAPSSPQTKKRRRLDVQVEASGFSRKMAKELEAYMKAVGVDGDQNGVALDGERESEGDGDGDGGLDGTRGGEEEDEEDEEDEDDSDAPAHAEDGDEGALNGRVDESPDGHGVDQSATDPLTSRVQSLGIVDVT